MENQPHLKKLVVSKEIFSDQQIEILLMVLSQNYFFSQIKFESDAISSLACTKIFEQLLTRPSTLVIEIASQNLGDSTLVKIAEILNKANIRREPLVLKIRGGCIGYIGALYLAEAIENQAPIDFLDLSMNTGLGDQGCERLIKAFQESKIIRGFSLECTGFGSAAAKALTDMFEVNHDIMIVMLSDIEDLEVSNSFRIALSDPDTKLKHISISCSHLSTFFIENLFLGMSPNLRLRRIHLVHCELGDDQIICLSRLIDKRCSLEILDLSSNTITSCGASYLATALMHNCSLRELDLKVNAIKCEGAWAISTALINNTYLTRLDLRSNKLKDRAIPYLADLLEQNKTLKKLYLGRNSFSLQSLKYFSGRLSGRLSLEVFELSMNRADEESIYPIFNMAAASKSLQTLIVSSNLMSARSVDALSNLLIRNNYLNTIEASLCKLGPEHARTIADALADNAGIAFLDLSGNDFGEESAAFIQSLDYNHTLCNFEIDCSREIKAELEKRIERNRYRYTHVICLDLSKLALDECFL